MGPAVNPNKKIPSLFEIKTQLVGEEGRRIAELEKEREKDLMMQKYVPSETLQIMEHGMFLPVEFAKFCDEAY